MRAARTGAHGGFREVRAKRLRVLAHEEVRGLGSPAQKTFGTITVRDSSNVFENTLSAGLVANTEYRITLVAKDGSFNYGYKTGA